MRTTRWMRQLAGWPGARQAEMKLALRVTIAGTLAFAITKALEFQQGYWAAITAVIVMQASVGGSLKAAVDRFSGTFAGAVYGAAVSASLSHESPLAVAGAMVVALFPLALLATVNPSFRVAPITALIMLLPPTGQTLGPLASALDRVLEIVLGNVVGVLVALFVLPARAHTLMAEAAAKVVSLNAEVVSIFVDELMARPKGRSGLQTLHPQIRAALKKAEAAADEAARERKSHLTDQADPEPLIRTLYRVRHDLVMVGRAAANPLPPPVLARLGPSLANLRDTTRQVLLDLALSLKRREAPPDSEPFRSAVGAFVSQTEALRSDPLARELPSEVFGQVFALGFAFEQLRKDMVDLLGRAHDLATRRVADDRRT